VARRRALYPDRIRLSGRLAEFVGVLVPKTAGLVTPIAIVALLAFVALQWGGVRISSRFQEITTAIKFAAFLALVTACMFSADR
jgi:amino acid transporter